MTTLAVDAPRDYGLGDLLEFPVVASDIIYEGAAVGEDTNGYARPLVAGDPFLGFATKKADNSSGSAGDINVTCRVKGLIKLPISAVAITSNDQPSVYASDDATFTLTAGSNTRIGNVAQWISTGYVWVNFDTPRAPAASIATGDLETDCVTGAKIADDAIDSEHYTDGSIDTAHLSADCVDGTKMADDAVSLEHLDAAITPSHICVYAGTETTTGGGAAEAHTVTGIVALTDFVLVTLIDNGTNNVTLLQSAVTDNTITNTFSGDPGGDTIFHYAVFRAAA